MLERRSNDSAQPTRKHHRRSPCMAALRRAAGEARIARVSAETRQRAGTRACSHPLPPIVNDEYDRLDTVTAVDDRPGHPL